MTRRKVALLAASTALIVAAARNRDLQQWAGRLDINLDHLDDEDTP
jgi:hypothetical protein